MKSWSVRSYGKKFLTADGQLPTLASDFRARRDARWKPTGRFNEILAKSRPAANAPIAVIPIADHIVAMSAECCSAKSNELEKLARQVEQRRVLVIVLAINAIMFVLEFGAGIIAGSTALMADASDMLGDALVYAVSIYALARSDRWKAGAAMLKGFLILALGVGIIFNVVAKIESGLPPSSALMSIFGGLALVANLACLRLLWRFRAQDVNMASTFECSRNDVINNCGVLLAAFLVWWFASPWPDIVIGGLMAVIFLRSAVRVIADAAPQLRAA